MRWTAVVLTAGIWLCADLRAARSETPAATPGSDAPTAGPRFALHVQATDVVQYTPPFTSPYAGQNSLKATGETANIVGASLFVGLQPWKGGQFWFDMDMDQGFALSDTLGVAGYVDGEGVKLGHHSPYYRPQRLFYQQTFDLGGGEADVDPGLFGFGGRTTKNRLVITVGKFSLTDVMDDNQYAHDPENDFLNWAIIDTGTFDYAADAWGFSEGGVAELYEGDWTLRGGVMDLSQVPNEAALTPWWRQYQLDGEVELRQRWLGRDGKLKLLAYESHGNMGRFDDAIRLGLATDAAPSTALVRHYHVRPGVSLELEQPVSEYGGLFVRAGWADGRYEPYEYADIDETVAMGGSLSGARWGRKDDTAALALVVNGISKVHQAYLAAGGLGILVGDGRLPHPGAEAVVEAYYSLGVINGVRLTLDSQTVMNPAYNRDRGPAEVIGLRLHGQY